MTTLNEEISLATENCSLWGTLLIDTGGNIKSVNQKFCCLFRVRKELLLNQPLRLVLPALFRLTSTPSTERCERMGGRLLKNSRNALELTVRTRNVIRQGKPHMFIMVAKKDIGDDQDAPQTVVSDTVTNTHVTVLDRNGQVIYANWLPAERLGGDFLELAYNGHKFDEAGNYVSDIIRVLETGDDEITKNEYNPILDKYFTREIRQIRDLDGQVIGVVSQCQCFARSELPEDTDSQDGDIGTLGKLARATAHEIRNPLTAISSLAQLGQISENEQRKNKIFERIVQQIESLNNFLEELTSLATPEEESLALGDPRKVVSEVIELIQGYIQLKNVAFTLKLNPEKTTVLLSPTLFKQALLNILKNSMEALPQEGELEIKSQIEDNHFVLEIRDNGEGIPPHVLENLGKPFITTKNTGTGLGLPITIHIIRKIHRGFIKFTSEQNKGTLVTIKFPLAKRC